MVDGLVAFVVALAVYLLTGWVRPSGVDTIGASDPAWVLTKTGSLTWRSTPG